MAELVYQDDGEERKIFKRVPDHRGIFMRPELDAVNRNEKPRPMDIHADSRQREDLESAFVGWHLDRPFDEIEQFRV
jgi:hypothetical protein